MDIITSALSWIECHPGTAAWVQAIGAIIALGIAIVVPICMAKNADRLNRKRFLESVASIGTEVLNCFINAATKCNHSEEQGRFFVRSVEAFHKFRIVSSAINAIPLYQLPTYETTQSVLELQTMMAEGLMQLDAAFEEINNYQKLIQATLYGEAFNKLVTRARPHLEQINIARRVL